MGRRIEPTVIVFPRISGRDGPARTLYKKQFILRDNDPGNPLHDPLRFGTADTEPFVGTRNGQDAKVQVRMNKDTVVHRNSQRFRGNFRKPDAATVALINRRKR